MLIVYCKSSLTLKYTQPSMLHGHLCWSDPMVLIGDEQRKLFFVETHNFQTFTHSILCISKSYLRVATNKMFLCYTMKPKNWLNDDALMHRTGEYEQEQLPATKRTVPRASTTTGNKKQKIKVRRENQVLPQCKLHRWHNELTNRSCRCESRSMIVADCRSVPSRNNRGRRKYTDDRKEPQIQMTS